MVPKCIVWLAALLMLAAPCLAQTGLRAYYDDDFILESVDSAFQLRIRGNFHLDTRFFRSDSRGAPHSLDLRRARMDLQGRIHERFTFRLQPELAGKPYIRNAWVDAEISPALHVRAGQMKVPFSSSWLTMDTNVNFMERGASSPILPFFDRGVVLWGEVWSGATVYNVGFHTGAGVDADVGSGDIDDHKDLSVRLFLQPFRGTERETLRGLYLVLQGTWGRMSVPTARYETKGYRSADYESAVWRWRSEQVIGTDGRVTDLVSAGIDARQRLGAELHHVRGRFAFSSELLRTLYSDIVLYHDFYVGSNRAVHQSVHHYGDGSVSSWSTWASWYLTGEGKRLTNQGWRTAKPEAPVGSGGLGAWEILARYSRTWTTRGLFVTETVGGFQPGSLGLPGGYTGATPGALNGVTAAVLDGAHDVHEVSAGLSWTLNPMVRIQLNDILLWAPDRDRNGDGLNDNYLVSGALSGQADPGRKNRKTRWENAVMLRLIFKL